MGYKKVHIVRRSPLELSRSKVKVVETNCAGDVFHGAFAAFIHQRYSIFDSMKFATATASLKCTKNGGIYSIPSYSSVKNFVKKIQIRKI